MVKNTRQSFTGSFRRGSDVTPIDPQNEFPWQRILVFTVDKPNGVFGLWFVCSQSLSPSCIMGLFDKLASMIKGKKEQVNILVIGLNNSGKSTIVNNFKEPEERQSIVVPTVGFNVERFQSQFNNIPYLMRCLKCNSNLPRSRDPVHCIRYVRSWKVPKPVGTSLQQMPRNRLCHRL